MLKVLSIALASYLIMATSIYEFKVPGLEGGSIDFSQYKGKKIMIVNTASKCGNTPQYAELEELYKKYKGKLVIIGFPANNFGGQEPGTKEEISEFCKRNYGVTFPMADKISVKGDDIAPIYKFLEEEAAKKGLADPVIALARYGPVSISGPMLAMQSRGVGLEAHGLGLHRRLRDRRRSIAARSGTRG